MASVLEQELYDAALKGYVTKSLQLLQQDPYLVERVSFSCSRNLLHVATMRGQAAIVAEVLKVNPQLAQNLDSQNQSPLHIAAKQGNFEITKILLSVAPEMCWWRDGQGMNPVHIAAMSGHVGVLEELIRHDSLPAMDRVDRGQTVLHLCAKHRHLAVFKVLVGRLGQLVPAKDDDGDTVLDLAVRSNQIDMIKYLVEEAEINEETMRSMKIKAVDLFDQSSRSTTSPEIKELLRITISATPQQSSVMMVVVVLIATMAFQAAISPPGGVWQEDTSSHKAGNAVMASTHPDLYRVILCTNTAAFVLCFFTITILILEVPYKLKSAGFCAFVTIFSTEVMILVSYGASIFVTTPTSEMVSMGFLLLMYLALVLILFSFVMVVEARWSRFLRFARRI